MNRCSALVAALCFAAASSLQGQQPDSATAARILFAPVSLQSPPQQRAIEHSDAYYTRLTIHRLGSYAMLPLFAGEYFLGNKLIHGEDDGGAKSTHAVVAAALGGLFAVNTVTGVWNLVESRQDPGAARRIVHAALMLAADAGIAYTATLAEDAGEGEGGNRHRDFALSSMAVASAGTLLMWLWKD